MRRFAASLACLGATVACLEGPFSLGIGPDRETPRGEIVSGGSAGLAGSAGSGNEMASGAGGGAGRTNSAGGVGNAGSAGSAASSSGTGGGGENGGTGGSAGGGDVTAAKGTLSLANVASDGTQANGEVLDYSMSSNGRYVAFNSMADNLVPGDTNLTWDVFLRDRQTATTILVSANEFGEQSNGGSTEPALSSDGRRVAFISLGTNLGVESMPAGPVLYLSQPFDGVDTFVPGLTPVTQPSFTGGASESAISQTGDALAYLWNISEKTDLMLFTIQDQTHRRLSDCGGLSVHANGGMPVMSADGKLVVFVGLIGGAWNVFTVDIDSGECEIVSVAFDGSAADGAAGWASISDDGRFVAFMSDATNLTADSDDDEGAFDVFVRDLVTRTTQRIDLDIAVENVQPFLSGDGHRIAFVARRGPYIPDQVTLFGIYVRDFDTGETFEIAKGEAGGGSPFNQPKLSRDGRVVAFTSIRRDLTPADTNGFVTDIFVFDFSEP